MFDFPVDDFNNFNLEINNNNCLKLYTLYDNYTVDYQGFYVIRLILVCDGNVIPTNFICKNTNLSELRKCIPKNLYCQTRAKNDLKNIIETWF